MDNEQATQSPKASKTPIFVAAAVLVIVIIAIVAFVVSKSSSSESEEALETQTGTQEVQNQQVQNTSPSGVMTEKNAYKDGTYEAVGNYVSPGGEESIDVTVTLKGGVVSDAKVVSNAFRPTSKQMQASFIGGFKEQVVGKSIDEIHLTKVAASSLAPKGFNDAVEKIKNQAKS